jgi:transposase-like protein
VRNCQYLINTVEQDHRALKGRCRPMLGTKSYRTAAATLVGIDLPHRIRKRQFEVRPDRWFWLSLKKRWDRALP